MEKTINEKKSELTKRIFIILDKIVPIAITNGLSVIAQAGDWGSRIEKATTIDELDLIAAEMDVYEQSWGF